MTAVLEDRTISMILTVPNVKGLSHSLDDLPSLSDDAKPPSIPIYYGSILHIEQHGDDRNTSDLIVRVPNFHHLSIPSVTISINETGSQREARTKRRAPICPIINGTIDRNKINSSENLNPNQSGLTNPKRLAGGFRNLRRTIVTNCKVKRSSHINQITLIPVLPDVEVIREDFEVAPSEKKSNKNSGSSSKFFTPKILFIKRKYFKTNKKRQPSANTVNAQTDCQEKRTDENSRVYVNLKDDGIEQQNKPDQEDRNTNFVFVNPETEEQSTTIAQLIPKIPISLTNTETSTNDIQADDHKENDDDDLEGRVYIVHPNGDTYSECYEVTYEFDPEFQRFVDQHKERIDLPEVDGTKLPSLEYQDYPSDSSLPILPTNEYEQLDHFKKESSRPRVTFQTVEIDPNQTLAYPPEPISAFSSSQENIPLICLNDSSMINEDYTVILQFLKHALQIESIPADHCNEFNKQIKELFQNENSNE